MPHAELSLGDPLMSINETADFLGYSLSALIHEALDPTSEILAQSFIAINEISA